MKIHAGDNLLLVITVLDKSGDLLTGLTPSLRIRLVHSAEIDGYYWTGAEFDDGVIALDMDEVDAVNASGRYSYQFQTPDNLLASDGAFFLVTIDAGADALDRHYTAVIEPVVHNWDAAVADHNSAGSFGANLQSVAGGASVTVLPLVSTSQSPQVAEDDVIVAQHSSDDIVWSIVDSAGDPVDLSGETVRLNVYPVRTPDTALFTLETGSGVVVSGAGNNVITATYTDAMTAVLGTFRYDIWMVESKRRVATGVFVVARAVKDGAA